MKIDFKVLALSIIGLLYSGLSFASDTYNCPSTARLVSGSVAPEDVPAGYESRVLSSVTHLSGYSLYDGPPENRGQLKGDYSKGNGTTWVLTPKLHPQLHTPLYPQGIWISCDYAGGLVKIAARARDSVTSCVATSKKMEPPFTLAVRFICK